MLQERLPLRLQHLLCYKCLLASFRKGQSTGTVAHIVTRNQIFQQLNLCLLLSSTLKGQQTVQKHLHSLRDFLQSNFLSQVFGFFYYFICCFLLNFICCFLLKHSSCRFELYIELYQVWKLAFEMLRHRGRVRKSHPSEELSHILSFSNSRPPLPIPKCPGKRDLVYSVLFSYSSLGFLPIWLILMHLSSDQLSVSVKAQTNSFPLLTTKY